MAAQFYLARISACIALLPAQMGMFEDKRKISVRLLEIIEAAINVRLDYHRSKWLSLNLPH